MLVGCIALAGLTKRFVEDPVRHWRPLTHGRVIWTYAAGAIAMALVAAITIVPVNIAQREANTVATRMAVRVNDGDVCLGARSLRTPGQCGTPTARPTWFSSLFAADDGPDPRYLTCIADPGPAVPRPCVFGSTDSQATKIALVGDSHAARYLPALEPWAHQQHVQLIVFLKNACPLITAQEIGPRWDNSQKDRDGCQKASRDILKQLTRTPGLTAVLFANRTRLYHSKRHPLRPNSIEPTMSLLRDHGIQPVLFRDVPERYSTARPQAQTGPDCIAEHTDPTTACSSSVLNRQREPDPMREAAASGSVPLIDLTSAFCDQRRCYSLIGGVSVYQDDNHVTATYMKTLAPQLGQQLTAVLP